jgi:hypothetical protein
MAKFIWGIFPEWDEVERKLMPMQLRRKRLSPQRHRDTEKTGWESRGDAPREILRMDAPLSRKDGGTQGTSHRPHL